MGERYRVFVGGLPWETDDRSLGERFSEYGEVIFSKVVMDRETGRSRGFGFVAFAQESSLDRAIQGLDGNEFGGRTITVNRAKERDEMRPPGSGGNSGGGGGYGGYHQAGREPPPPPRGVGSSYGGLHGPPPFNNPRDSRPPAPGPGPPAPDRVGGGVGGGRGGWHDDRGGAYGGDRGDRGGDAYGRDRGGGGWQPPRHDGPRDGGRGPPLNAYDDYGGGRGGGGHLPPQHEWGGGGVDAHGAYGAYGGGFDRGGGGPSPPQRDWGDRDGGGGRVAPYEDDRGGYGGAGYGPDRGGRGGPDRGGRGGGAPPPPGRGAPYQRHPAYDEPRRAGGRGDSGHYDRRDDPPPQRGPPVGEGKFSYGGEYDSRGSDGWRGGRGGGSGASYGGGSVGVPSQHRGNAAGGFPDRGDQARAHPPSSYSGGGDGGPSSYSYEDVRDRGPSPYGGDRSGGGGGGGGEYRGGGRQAFAQDPAPNPVQDSRDNHRRVGSAGGDGGGGGGGLVVGDVGETQECLSAE